VNANQMELPDGYLQVGTKRYTNTQYTPPTPKQLNCRVELRRRCVLNSQLVGDSLDESEQISRHVLLLSHWLQNFKLGHDSLRMSTHRRHNSTRQLSCERTSTCVGVEGRCVLGINGKW